MRTLVHWPVRDLTIAGLPLNQRLHTLHPENLDRASEQATAWVPAIEVHHTDTQVVLKVEVPGVAAKDLDVQVSREAVTIAGALRPTWEGTDRRVRSEFRYGKFQRVIPLRIPVQLDGVVADLTDGVLTLTLLKVVAPKVVKLSVQTPSKVATEFDSSVSVEPQPPIANVSAPVVDTDLTEDVWATEPAIVS
ncbi:MAG: Hsp20/alpha crystallin family protein [Leptolyngbyaceae cyanobacterium bins.59]|nr:Hsp20/alpha crystallin family protein [Leptolyngbyaceae cyanobacterium bins.59]